MPNYTYLLYYLNPQKQPKTHKWLTKSYKFIFMCFYVIQVQKDWKQVKTDQVHTKLQFQSLEFHKMSKLVPKSFKWLKSQLKSLGSQKYSQKIPGWKFTQNGNFYPSSIKIGKLSPWVFKTWKFHKIPLYYAWIYNLEQFW